MDAIQKDIVGRKKEIEKELELLFKANLKITDWDVPEADDREAANILMDILQKKLDKIKEDIDKGLYDNY